MCALVLHLFFPASSDPEFETMDAPPTPHWRRLLYWTAFWNTLLYLLVHQPPYIRLRHRVALAMGCYSYAYALLDEFRKQGAVSIESTIISIIAVSHMLWTYHQKGRMTVL